RNRQTQLRISAAEDRLVSEQKYDGEGRTSVNFLPAPATATDFRYEALFNAVQNANGQNQAYDTSVFEGVIPPPAAPSSGAGQYFSPAAQLSAPEDSFVPDAGGYPYSFEKHTRDDTGRP